MFSLKKLFRNWCESLDFALQPDQVLEALVAVVVFGLRNGVGFVFFLQVPVHRIQAFDRGVETGLYVIVIGTADEVAEIANGYVIVAAIALHSHRFNRTPGGQLPGTVAGSGFAYGQQRGDFNE